METQACCDKMYPFETEEVRKCIKEHPGLNEVILNEWIVEYVALGLKTKGRKSYACVFQQVQKTRSK